MQSILELFKAIGPGLVLLLPLANPLTTVALLLGLSGNMTSEERNHQSKMASIYVFFIMTIAFYAGQVVMNTFGISIPKPAYCRRSDCGIYWFPYAFPTTISGRHSVRSKITGFKAAQINQYCLCTFSHAQYCRAGTIAMIISSAASIKGHDMFSPWVVTVAPVLIFLSVSLILWGSLLSSGAIMRWVGKSGIEAISRLMGFLLVCMGVQFIINGVLDIIANYQPVVA